MIDLCFPAPPYFHLKRTALRSTAFRSLPFWPSSQFSTKHSVLAKTYVSAAVKNKEMSTPGDNTPHTAKVFTCAFLLLTVCCLPSYISSANILCFFPTFSPTTLYLHSHIAQVLANSGHNVTVIGTLPNPLLRSVYQYIEIKFTLTQMEMLKPFERTNSTAFEDFLPMLENAVLLSDMTLSKPLMQNWIKNAKQSDFDLLILGYFLNDFPMGLASLYNCPIIISMTSGPAFWIDRLVGNPAEGRYVPSVLTPYSQPMDFENSWNNFWITFWERTHFSRAINLKNEWLFW